ncbi:uncharacterized protein [Palaemon carinicauda]|uniref:uncharacterized protein n=1 Tax=Palaemon carinicauda TaxID=392227 RepID=UPI0035B5DA90
MTWQKPNKKIQSTKHVGHPAHPSTVMTSPTPPFSMMSVLADLDSGYLLPRMDIIPQPQRRFAHIHMDIVGLLPTSQGHRYLFTVIDHSTCWPEAIPMETSTFPSCTSALISRCIARFGIPEHINSDWGTTFTFQLWTSLANLQGNALNQTTAYNPAANRMVERFYHTLKASLISHCKESNLFTQLPLGLLGQRTTPKDAAHVSTTEMVYGDPLVVPADFIFPLGTSFDNLQCLCHIAGKFIPCHQTYKPPVKQHILTDQQSATHVFLLNAPLHRPFPRDPSHAEGFLH